MKAFGDLDFHSVFDVIHPLKHPYIDTTVHSVVHDRKLSYRFHTHYHPYVGQLVDRLIERSIAGLQGADTEYDRAAPPLPDGRPRPVLYNPIFSEASYAPADPESSTSPYPVRDLDFAVGAYGIYNWELFFHIPLTLGIHLSRSGRYEQAQRWFHYIFDPTDDSDGPTPDRYWKVRPFHGAKVAFAEEILTNLATGADPDLRAITISSIAAWQDAPFRPHVVAAFRPSAYMVRTVTAYLDNLIAWGDSLYRQDTRETINEAFQLYVLAALILGPRPQLVPRRGTVKPQSYAQLRPHLDAFNNVLRDLETDIVFNVAPLPSAQGGGHKLASIDSLGRSLYFCVPRNARLLEYWSTVSNRLFNIRNSLNIEGVFRQLALFEPPIDPALLARAAAAGLDVAAVISGLNQPLPLVRFRLLVQKALEVCREVQSLGSALLSAMEKEDSEALQILRAKHERAILGLGETVRYAHHQEAIKAREGLEKTLEATVERYRHYERMLGREGEEIKVPGLDPLDLKALEDHKLRASEPAVGLRDIEMDIATGLSGDLQGRILSSREKEELDKLATAHDFLASAATLDRLAGVLGMLPNFGVHIQPFGPGGSITFGGSNISAALGFAAGFSRTNAETATYLASRASKIGSYARREQDWAFQSNLAVGEINQIVKQLRAAQIREAIAERELSNHRQQMEHAAAIETFLADERKAKKTSKALYTWMKREVRGLYGQMFQFAYDIAKKAERGIQHELGDRKLSFLQYGYIGGREGLLAGEKLLFDVHRMEMAYHDLNRRELELTRHISLMQVDPLALLQLRMTGVCSLTLPEELFDLDGAGHYFRRIRSVAVSIPSVVGPYTSVRCTLTLLKSAIRLSPLLGEDGYPESGSEDTRFDRHFGSVQSIVTSSGQNDTGLFDAGQGGDERYLPFENSGVINSEWRIELPRKFAEFSYDSISDVILHFRYTARQGGDPLRRAAEDHLGELISEAKAAGMSRLFSLRHDFPNEWARFKRLEPTDEAPFLEFPLNIAEEHYPFWTKGLVQNVESADLIVRPSGGGNSLEVAASADPANDARDTLTPDASLGGLLRIRLDAAAPAAPIGEVRLFVATNAIDDAWLAIKWKSD